jgi:hypothetical protein
MAQPSAVPTATLVAADETEFVGDTDSNSPALWERVDGRSTLFVLNSHSGEPALSAGRSLARLSALGGVTWSGDRPHGGIWMEAVLTDESGTWYGYYHNEQATSLCPGSMKVLPRIGAARSTDRGATWQDLGAIIEGGVGDVRCATRNHYFHGGVGDFSVALDADGQFLYIFYTQYREPAEVGVAVARMAWAARDEPRGAVDIWQRGTWLPPLVLAFESDGEAAGTPGETALIYPVATPISPQANSWDNGINGVDVFWGPSVHWNTALRSWVMLLNRANSNEWGQEGIYVSYNTAIDDPAGWSAPQQILQGGQWYPQVIGLEPGRGTDKQAGEVARFFMGGRSSYLIRFGRR